MFGHFILFISIYLSFYIYRFLFLTWKIRNNRRCQIQLLQPSCWHGLLDVSAKQNTRNKWNPQNWTKLKQWSKVLPQIFTIYIIFQTLIKLQVSKWYHFLKQKHYSDKIFIRIISQWSPNRNNRQLSGYTILYKQ